MKNPFKAYQEYVKKTPRNSFDMSHSNNLTLPFGQLVPNLVLDVTAGDSMSLDSAFGFNFYPMVFPIQTPIRINQYYFFVRYRNCMDSYEDMRYGNKSDIVHPYLKQPASFFKTCSLADYMGIPTTLAVGEHGYLRYPLDGQSVSSVRLSSLPSASLTSVNTGASPVFKRFSKDPITQAFSSAGAVGASSATRAHCYFYLSDSSVSVGTNYHQYFLETPFSVPSSVLRTLLYAFRVCNIDMPLFASDGHCYLHVHFFTTSAIGSSLNSVHILAVNPNTADVVFDFSGCNASYDEQSHVLTFDVYDFVDSLNALLESFQFYDLFVVIDSLDFTEYKYAETFVLDDGVSVPIVATSPNYET